MDSGMREGWVARRWLRPRGVVPMMAFADAGRDNTRRGTLYPGTVDTEACIASAKRGVRGGLPMTEDPALCEFEMVERA